MSIYQIPIASLQGNPALLNLVEGKVTLVVNVASACGLTPQYTALEQIHEQFAERGFSVVGVPCNQFMGQEPGTPEEIAEFCSSKFGVTFPLSEKVDVNGDARHALYTQLTQKADSEAVDGDIRWNFEKFLVGRNGDVLARFGPMVLPDAPEVLSAIESALA